MALPTAPLPETRIVDVEPAGTPEALDPDSPLGQWRGLNARRGAYLWASALVGIPAAAGWMAFAFRGLTVSGPSGSTFIVMALSLALFCLGDVVREFLRAAYSHAGPTPRIRLTLALIALVPAAGLLGFFAPFAAVLFGPGFAGSSAASAAAGFAIIGSFPLTAVALLSLQALGAFRRPLPLVNSTHRQAALDEACDVLAVILQCLALLGFVLLLLAPIMGNVD